MIKSDLLIDEKSINHFSSLNGWCSSVAMEITEWLSCDTGKYGASDT